MKAPQAKLWSLVWHRGAGQNWFDRQGTVRLCSRTVSGSVHQVSLSVHMLSPLGLEKVDHFVVLVHDRYKW